MEKYRPDSGTEGAEFFELWCCNCARDKNMSEGKDYDDCSDGDLCEIIARTMAYDEEEPEYPSEWTYDYEGDPCCTAFVQAGSDLPKARCSRTRDMFMADTATQPTYKTTE